MNRRQWFALLPFFAAFTIGAASIGAAFAPKPAPALPPLALANVQLLDGDTIRGDVLLPYGVALWQQDIRANDYDAWESSKRRRSRDVTDAEVAKGKAARDALAELLGTGKLYVVPEGGSGRDVFGRLLGALWLLKDDEWISVAEWMKSHGHDRGDAP